MYYELYVDVLFLVNFFMDYILLLLVKKILHCETSHVRILAGAGIGAAITCTIVILPIPNTFLEVLMFHVIVNTCMIQVGLKIKNTTVFMRAILLLYIGSFLMGGMLNSLDQYVKWGSFVCVFAILGFYLCLGVWNFLSKLHRWNETHVKVKIRLHGQEIELNALIDTGNSLYDPVTGKPVSIISKQVGKTLLREGMGGRYISLRTLTNIDSFLPLICIEKLWILDDEYRCFQHVLFAVANEEFSKNGTYQVILNPNLF